MVAQVFVGDFVQRVSGYPWGDGASGGLHGLGGNAPGATNLFYRFGGFNV